METALWIVVPLIMVSVIAYFVGDDDDKMHALIIAAFAVIIFLFSLFYYC